MLVIQIPVLVAILWFLGYTLFVYVFLKLGQWYFQSKALKYTHQQHIIMPVDRSQAWNTVRQLHAGGEGEEYDEM